MGIILKQHLIMDSTLGLILILVQISLVVFNLVKWWGILASQNSIKTKLVEGC